LLSIKSLGVIFPAACCAWDSPSLSDFDTPLLAAGFFIMLRAKINYQNTGLAMKRDYGAANPKSIDGLNRAMIEAYGFIFHKDNKQAVKEIIARNLRLPKVEAAEDYYLEALEELDRKPYPSLDGMRIVIKYVAEQNPKATGIKVEEIVDTSWLRKLDAEGFFETAYGGK
jgi:hypothetical protein